MDAKDLLETPDLNEDILQKLLRLISVMNGYEETIVALEDDLRKVKAKHREMSTEQIPELMSELGIEEFTLEDGRKVKVEDTVSGSLPKDRHKRAEALEWLRKHGGDGMIKDSFAISFGKDQDQEAEGFAESLHSMNVPFERKEDVHPMTLKAYAREMMGQGEIVDFETLGLWHGKITKVRTK